MPPPASASTFGLAAPTNIGRDQWHAQEHGGPGRESAARYRVLIRNTPITHPPGIPHPRPRLTPAPTAALLRPGPPDRRRRPRGLRKDHLRRAAGHGTGRRTRTAPRRHRDARGALRLGRAAAARGHRADAARRDGALCPVRLDRPELRTGPRAAARARDHPGGCRRGPPRAAPVSPRGCCGWSCRTARHGRVGGGGTARRRASSGTDGSPPSAGTSPRTPRGRSPIFWRGSVPRDMRCFPGPLRPLDPTPTSLTVTDHPQCAELVKTHV